jgi:hypothetical protein
MGRSCLGRDQLPQSVGTKGDIEMVMKEHKAMSLTRRVSNLLADTSYKEGYQKCHGDQLRA